MDSHKTHTIHWVQILLTANSVNVQMCDDYIVNVTMAFPSNIRKKSYHANQTSMNKKKNTKRYMEQRSISSSSLSLSLLCLILFLPLKIH